MNVDIRLSVGFWQHPKTYRLEKRIGLKGVRSLQILWCWCAQNRPDGKLHDLNADEIEFVADWRGKKGAFVTACVDCDWLDQTDNGFLLHEWADYNPYQAQAGNRAEARKEKARKAANVRWGKGCQSDANECSSNANAYAKNEPSICSNDAQAYANECSSNAISNAQAMPTSTYTSTSKEIKKESSLRSDSFCEEQSCDSSPRNVPMPEKRPPDILPVEQPLIKLPLNNGQLHAVKLADADHWQELYPAVDVH